MLVTANGSFWVGGEKLPPTMFRTARKPSSICIDREKESNSTVNTLWNCST
jgi:hypothetical protein